MEHIRPVPDDYRDPCERGGRLEELPVPGYSPAVVYLPYGYDESSARYATFYLLHRGAVPYAFFTEDGLLKNMLDHMIDRGEIEPMIVVAPTYFQPGHEADGADYASEAVLAFGPVLIREIIPLVDRTCRTYTDRKHRAVGGFSMGAVTVWYVLMAGKEAFHWFLPMSGDCWICGRRGGGKHPQQTASLLSNTLMGSSFRLHVITGTEDPAYPSINPQMKAMKDFPHVFTFGRNTKYTALAGGVQGTDIRPYLYIGLPELFR